jgi:TusA-related sulfurtransferase
VRKLIVLVAAAFVLNLGCEEKKPPPTAPTAAPTTPPPATTTPTTTASAQPEAGAPALAEKGGKAHCPGSVTGATTAIKDVEGGVELTVTAKDAAATADIRARAKAIVDAAKTPDSNVKHTGKGEGGGIYGKCPVVMKNTTVDAKDTEGGSVITVKAKDAKEVDFLRRETRDRQNDLGAPNDPSGAGKMSHCPSAVEGAITKVDNIKDGVTVTVSAKGDKVKEVQSRAKHLLEAAKKNPDQAKHTGDGMGGGGLGRCPVVLKDTKVEVKDTPDGAIITVKPEKATELANLQKEAKERAEKFK